MFVSTLFLIPFDFLVDNLETSAIKLLEYQPIYYYVVVVVFFFGGGLLWKVYLSIYPCSKLPSSLEGFWSETVFTGDSRST